MVVYMVRIRDVLNGRERWLESPEGERFVSDDRRTADWAALAMARRGTMELPYVVEVDPQFERV